MDVTDVRWTRTRGERERYGLLRSRACRRLQLIRRTQSQERCCRIFMTHNLFPRNLSLCQGSAKFRIRSPANNKSDDDEITEEKLDDLYNWLDEIKLSKPKKNLAREFSDGVLLAELLKQYFPKKVDLNNYRPANSMTNKLKNWKWLNEKVLKSLGIMQDEKTIKNIIDFNLPKLEKLLLLIKEKADEQEELRLKKEQELHTSVYGSGMVAELNIETVSKEYNSLKEQLQEKNEELSTLEAKVEHLQAMLEIKDQRIDDLMAQVKNCTCQDQAYRSPKYKRDSFLGP